MDTSRRALLRSIGTAGAVAAGAGTMGVQTASAQDRRRGAVIPTVEEFEDNYTGQWIELNEQTSASGEPVGGCDQAEWSADETQAYNGFLMDRRTGSAPIIELDVLTEGAGTGPEEDTTYVVNETTECGNDFVFLDLRAVPIRSVAGAEPGPEADQDGGDGDGTPGFGIAAAAAALGASAVARVLRRDDG
ncbi:hypothetical protein ACFQDG_11475 [Natronoarchaeum mannanilyticum]|uniref:PGF-CTERM sorting domain-containing protein n=1 Tax=Natronoarchaeum mannanilyticum TaxID=926360 RepID=A0AAV3T642_9EURY